MKPRTKAFAAISALMLIVISGGVIWLNIGDRRDGDMVGAWAAVRVNQPSAKPAHVPQHIASLNLCTDLLLLALAGRGQIAALTRFASDANMSAAANMAKSFPVHGRSSEALLTMPIDMLIGMPATGSPQAQLLAKVQLRKMPSGKGEELALLDMPWSNSYADIQANFRLLGDAIGKRGKAEALIRAMDAELAVVAPNGQGRIAAYYQRRGFMTGTGTLVDDMMRRVGLVNLAEKLGKPALAQLSLEEMVAAKPDFLIFEQGGENMPDQGSEMLQHPALRHIPRLIIPEALTVCGGPEYPRAIRALAAQINQADARANQ